jgi:hypothetical protein
MESKFYLAVAVVVSGFQAYRGYKIGSGSGWPLNGIAEGFFYSVCSVLGFVSFVLAYHMLFHGPPMWDLSASALAFIALLGFVGVTGISGQLPPLIQRQRVSIPGASTE